MSNSPAPHLTLVHPTCVTSPVESVGDILKFVDSQSVSDLGTAEGEYKDALIAVVACRSEISKTAEATEAELSGPLEDLDFALEEHQGRIERGLAEITEELSRRPE